MKGKPTGVQGGGVWQKYPSPRLGLSVYITIFLEPFCNTRDVSSTRAESEMDLLKTIANGFLPLTIVTKNSILDFSIVLETSLIISVVFHEYRFL